MAEYIEREALLTKALKEKRFVFQMEDLINNEIVVKTVYSDFAEFVNSIPAADVVEVKRGRWETTMVAPAGELVRWTHVHKECGYLYTDLRTKGHNFCPSCGARMEGDHG